MINKIIIIHIILLISISSIFSNGSPIYSDYLNTGNIEPLHEKDIQLIEETLKVKLIDDYAHVEVEYKLKNNGDSDTVKYGFPVEYREDYFAGESEDKDNKMAGWIFPSVYFQIKDNNKFLPVDCDLNFATENSDIPIAWYITDLEFAKNELKTLMVKYSGENQYEDGETEKSPFRSFSERTFKYSLKQAGNWGNGKINKCNISIDISEIINNGGTVKIEPKGYKIINNIVSWKFNNIYLDEIEDINVIYNISNYKYSKIYNQKRFPIYSMSVKASSTLKSDKYANYEIKNLFDNNFNTAWVEGKRDNGIGEYIELEFKEGIYLGGIAFFNGYGKNEKLYYENNRIKKIKIKVEYFGGTNFEEVITLEDRKYNEFNKKIFTCFLDKIFNIGIYPDTFEKKVKKIRITILEVYPGEKYEDTCISELYIFEW
jgi:hypothetical protein